MKPTVLIPTKGRPQVLEGTVSSVCRQTFPPSEIVIIGTADEDIPESVRRMGNTRVLIGGPGLTIQRNIGMSALQPDADPVIFLDDDVELAEDYLERAVDFLVAHPEVVGLTGVTVHDGPCSREDAIRMVREASERTTKFWDANGLYGCNMVMRARQAGSLRFDERLALYGWLEDKDFSVRLGRLGALACVDSARLVHMAVPSGRVSGAKLGFAQVMNPVYLWRVNRTIPGVLMLRYVLRALMLNTAGLVRPLGIDRRGRLKGNVRALRLLAVGRIEPEAVRAVS